MEEYVLNIIEITKNIMKRRTGRRQYTVSIPDTVGQLLEVESRTNLYMIQHETGTPGTYIVDTVNPGVEGQEVRSIFPNGKYHYFTLPKCCWEHLKEEQINKAIFRVDFNQVNSITRQPGRIILEVV